MKRWHLIIDVARCENCNNCFLACKDEHCGNDWPGYAAPQPLHGQRWMNIRRRERGRFPAIDVAYRPTPCMHCDNAPCIGASKGGAVVKRTDGIVLIDPAKAVGQKALVDACPYGAIWWNADRQIPQKCTLCAHLLDSGWQAPRCVQACPTGALSVVLAEPEEMERKAKKDELATLACDGPDTQPAVYYRNLYRFEKVFIAGSVALREGDREACAAGAVVRLLRDGEALAKTVCDAFGDYKFDRLEPNSGKYRLEISYRSLKTTVLDVDLHDSTSLGTIRIGSLD